MSRKITVGILILLILGTLLNYKRILFYFYPVHYEEIVTKYSEKYEIDPYLVYALIKTESKFNPYAKSHKGAIGLMQITPKTGSYLAGLIKENGFEEEMLYNPERNIKYGCFYLSKLSKDFEGNLDLVLAAYNGGEGNVRKWIKSDEDGKKYLNPEEVPFKETKNYIKKVKSDYKIYRFIYTK